MPLSINVGSSRKASKDYQSTGVSINVTAELDQSLLAKPDELHRQVANLYAQAESALDRQSGQSPVREAAHGENGNGRRNGTNGSHARPSNGTRRPAKNDALMTDSQKRALISIAERNNVNLDLEAREIIGAEFDQLTLRQASQLIDHLKSDQPSRSAR